jgi:hypothetical protein
MNTNPNNSVLVNRIIRMGVTDPAVAHAMMEQYLRTGKLKSVAVPTVKSVTTD